MVPKFCSLLQEDIASVARRLRVSCRGVRSGLRGPSGLLVLPPVVKGLEADDENAREETNARDRTWFALQLTFPKSPLNSKDGSQKFSSIQFSGE